MCILSSQMGSFRTKAKRGDVSSYRLQIVDAKTGQVAQGWQPGDKTEIDLVDDLCGRLKGSGIGVFRTEAKVIEAVRSEFQAMILDLKRRV